MKKVIPLAFCIVVLCCMVALGLGSCKKAEYNEILSENHSCWLSHVGPLSIAAGQPAQYAVDLSPNIKPDDVVAVFTTDEGEVVKSPQAKSVYITYQRPGYHTLEVKIYLSGVRDRVLCQDEISFQVK
ncbi:MAG: hypothetical protein EHM12_04300 [Dehalococcoidia bacterium]|nr:MAG: hypothetical protein EHM12_04300 [Dehalococcoidia bacterium]